MEESGLRVDSKHELLTPYVHINWFSKLSILTITLRVKQRNSIVKQILELSYIQIIKMQ